MQKLKLIVEELQVESFGTSPAPTESRGTVRAYGLWTFGACSDDVIIIDPRDVVPTEDLCTHNCQNSIDLPCWSIYEDLC